MSSTAIRFGKLESITTDGITTVTQFQKIHNYETAIQMTKTTIDIMADNRKKVLAEVLKLADKLNEDNICEIAFECKKRVDNAVPYKMSVSWVSK